MDSHSSGTEVLPEGSGGVILLKSSQFTSQMYTYTAEDVLQSLAIDSDFYETQEEWDKLDRVMELFKFVKKNAADGLINLTEEQRDVYWGTI